MKLLKCKLCHGEVDIIGNFRAITKKIKCRECHYSNASKEKTLPEVVVLKKK